MPDFRATYRVQLHAGFGFDDVAAIAPYLAGLGVSHVYCSPYLQAAPGSTHGYDVVDHTTLSDELGGDDAYRRMVAALASHGLGHIADIVPNHMGISPERANAAWWDVLTLGRTSAFAHWFDIDWDRHGGKILLPVLADPLDEVLRREEIAVDEKSSVIRYGDRELPLAEDTARAGDVAEILENQHYLLCDWRRGDRAVNYRRFFDVGDLAGLRVDDPSVFAAVHAKTLELVMEGGPEGLRIDHIDGLRDPAGYLQDLRAAARVPLWVEDILERGERLPGWPVEGTTGYDFLDLVGGLFVNRGAETILRDTFERFIGEPVTLAQERHAKKMLVMRRGLASELSRTAEACAAVFEEEGWAADVDVLRVALAEVIAALGVYRTYVAPNGSRRSTDDRLLREAIALALARAPHVGAETFDHLEQVLIHGAGGDAGLELLLLLQQTSGAVMAKGVEDTLYYDHPFFIGLNEVGCSPERFGTKVGEFHEAAAEAAARRPRSLLATSTHDTKRSEDVRARLAVLSHVPEAWDAAVERWSKTASAYRSGDAPGRRAEYYFFQTLVGAWPLTEDRALAHMEKAVREAKRRTSWRDPDPGYERAVARFVSGVLSDHSLMEDIEAFVTDVAPAGHVNSLAQTLLKLTYPGLPDIYQGTDTFDLSLADPDNRRPVDYDARRAILAGSGDPAAAWAGGAHDAAKLTLIARVLSLRARRPEPFRGGYDPLEVRGPGASGHLGFVRGNEVCTVVPLTGGAVDTDCEILLPPGRWEDLFTDGSFSGATSARELLQSFPVALLLRNGSHRT